MAGGPDYEVTIKDGLTGILIFRWSGHADNEKDALARAETALHQEGK